MKIRFCFSLVEFIFQKASRVLIVLNIDDCDELRIWDCESNREMRVISLEQFDGKLRPADAERPANCPKTRTDRGHFALLVFLKDAFSGLGTQPEQIVLDISFESCFTVGGGHASFRACSRREGECFWREPTASSAVVAQP